MAACPERMRTEATTGVLNVTPTKENPAASDRTGALTVRSNRPRTSKKARAAPCFRSTSEKTTPKPFTTAGVTLPATTKCTVNTLLPTATKILVGLKAANWLA